jgi:hypothetical protein
VLILKGALPAGQKLPTAVEEVDASKFVELDSEADTTVAAKRGKCKGKRHLSFVRVRLLGASAARLSSVEVSLVCGGCKQLTGTHVPSVVVLAAAAVMSPNPHGSSEITPYFATHTPPPPPPASSLHVSAT